jgi:hypothetical protein
LMGLAVMGQGFYSLSQFTLCPLIIIQAKICHSQFVVNEWRVSTDDFFQ